MKQVINPADSDQFVSTRQAAQMLGVALRTAQLWVESGRLVAWKTAGGHRRIARASVEDLLAERQRALAAGQGRHEGRLAKGAASRATQDLLVVEDDPVMMRLYEYHFEEWDLPLRVHMARDGFEGLRLLGECHPDILVSDLSMPGIDGFRMLRTVASWEDYRDMLTIVVTALSPADVKDRGGLPAHVKLFTKPAPFGELERLIRERIGAGERTGEKAASAA